MARLAQAMAILAPALLAPVTFVLMSPAQLVTVKTQASVALIMAPAQLLLLHLTGRRALMAELASAAHVNQFVLLELVALIAALAMQAHTAWEVRL